MQKMIFDMSGGKYEIRNANLDGCNDKALSVEKNRALELII